jgi:hypothetical protein
MSFSLLLLLLLLVVVVVVMVEGDAVVGCLWCTHALATRGQTDLDLLPIASSAL